MAQINVSELFKQIRLKLKLQWLAGLDGGNKILTSGTVTKPSLALVGHLNFVHPNRVQVLGCAEMDYLRNLSIIAMQQSISNLFSTDLAAIIVANGEKPPQELIKAANESNTPLFTSPMQSPQLMELLSHYLAIATAESVGTLGLTAVLGSRLFERWAFFVLVDVVALVWVLQLLLGFYLE